jgi:hypothetical protein
LLSRRLCLLRIYKFIVMFTEVIVRFLPSITLLVVVSDKTDGISVPWAKFDSFSISAYNGF